MSKSPDQRSSHPYICPDCGTDVGFRSRPRTLTERFILPLLLLRPVRCGYCFRRDYRLIFTQVRDRLSEVTAMKTPLVANAAPARPTNRNVA
jgi:hypothetical protein